MIRLPRRPKGWVATSMLIALVLCLGSSARVPAANSSLLPPGALAPTARQRMVARRVGAILEEAHYSRRKIDNTMSPAVFKRYLEFLDGQHCYFLASDIAGFQRWKDRFDDMIHSGDIDPAFVIFARFQQRNRERIEYAISLLKKKPDFSTDATYRFDRKDAPWPANEAAMDQLWRKRVMNDEISLMLDGKTWQQAVDTLHKRYEHGLKRVSQIESEDVFENLMNAYARTFDPHSSYFSPRNSEEYRIQMSLNYDGIGASLQLIDDYVTVMTVIQGGPAAVAGTLKAKDRITAVGQGDQGPMTDVIGWRLDDVVQLIRGKAGTVVRLKILPPGAAPGSPEKVLTLTRGKVTLAKQASHSSLKTVTRNGRTLKIGVIDVPAFYEDIKAENAGDKNARSTTRDVRRLIDKLQAKGINGLVLDLRDDGGGYLPEATALTGLFIDKGPVVQLKDATGHVEVLDDPETAPLYTGPLEVLVNRFSASASEIFAGAIQDYHRGLIVGQNTFGKGTVQNLIPLDRWTQRPVNGQLTVTIGKFYRVTGESTQHKGVVPDVTLPSPIDVHEVGESSLENSLPWDVISGVPFTPWSMHPITPDEVAHLDADEKARAAHDPDYRWLVQSIAASEALRARKTVSLNLDARRKERDAQNKATLARDNALRTAEGMPVLKSVKDIDDKDIPDVVLVQATQIMADMIAGPQVGPQQTASRRVAHPQG